MTVLSGPWKATVPFIHPLEMQNARQKEESQGAGVEHDKILLLS